MVKDQGSYFAKLGIRSIKTTVKARSSRLIGSFKSIFMVSVSV